MTDKTFSTVMPTSGTGTQDATQGATEPTAPTETGTESLSNTTATEPSTASEPVATGPQTTQPRTTQTITGWMMPAGITPSLNGLTFEQSVELLRTAVAEGFDSPRVTAVLSAHGVDVSALRAFHLWCEHHPTSPKVR